MKIIEQTWDDPTCAAWLYKFFIGPAMIVDGVVFFASMGWIDLELAANLESKLSAERAKERT